MTANKIRIDKTQYQVCLQTNLRVLKKSRFAVIPAPYQVRDKLRQESILNSVMSEFLNRASRFFMSWIPVCTGMTKLGS